MTCWQCGLPADALFCGGCKALQPPPSGYFEFYGFPRKLAIDSAELQRRYYALSRQLHPDRFTRRSAREQALALEASSILNDGLRVLRDPVERAEYVLTAEGFAMPGQRTKDVPPELLEEVFELNLALEEMRSGDASARPALETARSHFQSMLNGADSELAGLFARWDESGDRAELARIRGVLNRRKYITNLVRDVNQALQ